MVNIFDALGGLAGPAWLAALSVAGLLIKQLVPLFQLKVQSEGSLRADYMGEIKQLRQELREERLDCDRRLRALEQESDTRIRALEEQVAGLQRLIIQNSQSGAVMLSDVANHSEPGAEVAKNIRRSMPKDGDK